MTQPFSTRRWKTGFGILTVMLALMAPVIAGREASLLHLDTLGGSHSYASAVSSTGVVVGTSLTPGDTGSHAFVFTKPHGLLDIGTLGGYYSSAVAVSDNGHYVVGRSYTTLNAAVDAFLWTRHGGMLDLGSQGRGSSQATAVNNTGLVAGVTGVPGSGTFRAFAWTRRHGMVDLGLGG